jgi:hypothetical protein
MEQKYINPKVSRISQDTLIVGIDIAKRNHWVRMTDYRGIDLISHFKINNTIDGIKRLEEK